MKMRYISDCHFGHANCLAYDNRPWKDIKTADKAMIDLWNEHVAQDDVVYVLGDFVWGGFKNWEKIVRELNGVIYFIKGNHDKLTTIENICSHFPQCYYGGEQMTVHDDGDRTVVLNHCPILTYPNAHNGWYHLYGHVHNGLVYNATLHQQEEIEDLFQKKFKMYNVGAMMIGYYPRTLDEIINLYGGNTDGREGQPAAKTDDKL